MSLQGVKKVLAGTYEAFNQDRVVKLSAALAYYAIFSIGPLLLIVVAIAGAVLGAKVVRQDIQDQLQSLVGPAATQIIQSMISAQKVSGSLLAAAIGLFGLISGASGIFGELQDDFNTIWDVAPRPGRGIKGIIRDRLMSWAMVFGICFLLLVSMVVSTVLAASTDRFEGLLHVPVWIGQVIDFLISFGVITLLFAAMFKFVPDAKIPWRMVWGGAMVTAALFSAGKVALAFYLGRASTSSSYGAAGSVVIILMWVYYAALIVFIGAELTHVYTMVSGVTIRPSSNAIALGQATAGLPPPLGPERRKGDRRKTPQPQLGLQHG